MYDKVYSMSTINVGTEVYWVQKTKNREIERVGKVIGVVPPECSPNNIIPNFVKDTVSLRNFTTYLVRVYGSEFIYWASSVSPLPDTKRHLITEQVPVTSNRSFIIDRTDRIKIKKLCKELNAEFTESEDHLNVITWGKRFIFRILGGIEFVSTVEQIKFV